MTYSKKYQSIIKGGGDSTTPSLATVMKPLMSKHVNKVIGSCHGNLLLWLCDQIISCNIPPKEGLSCKITRYLINIKITFVALWLLPPDDHKPTDENMYNSISLHLFMLLTEWISEGCTVAQVLLQKLFKVH